MMGRTSNGLLLLTLLSLSCGTVLAQNRGSSVPKLDLLIDHLPPTNQIVPINLAMIDLAPSMTQASGSPDQTQAQTQTPPQPPSTTQTPSPAQTPLQAPNPTEGSAGSLTGTVVSVSSQTMVVRTEDNRSHLFVFDSGMVRPKGLTPGARIRVQSNTTDESGVSIATRISVLEPPSEGTSDMAPPPKEISATAHEIEKLTRRWQVGVRIGAGLDPELFLIGAQTSIGPIFSKDFYFRPNAEFAFGELTDMIAINLEGVYRLPLTLQQGRWSAYVGAGPGLNFVHKGLDKSDTSFSDFDYQTGLNVFSGVRFRRGTFVEIKGSLWAPGVPTLRLILGYVF